MIIVPFTTGTSNGVLNGNAIQTVGARVYFGKVGGVMTKAEAIERLENDCCKSRVYCELYPDICMKEECEIYMAIEALKERPTGKWIEITTKENEEMAFLGWVECSNCKSKVVLCSDFCPDCGADMRGEDGGMRQ